MFALRRIPEGGCILADEVGLGKTIEADCSAADKGREQSSETERRERGRLETARKELTAKSREIAATATLLQQAQAQNRKNEAVSRRVTELTDGAYGEVSIAPTLATENIEAAGSKRDLSRLSAGTLDQLATVLRLTIAEKLGSTVVLDDQLVQSDGGLVFG